MSKLGILTLIEAVDQRTDDLLPQLERKRLIQSARDELETLTKSKADQQAGIASMIWCIVAAAGGTVRVTKDDLAAVCPTSRLVRRVEDDGAIVFIAEKGVEHGIEGSERQGAVLDGA